MKKLLQYTLCAFLTVAFDLRAQVWFPEGGYDYVQPTAFTIDNGQVYTIGKAGEDLSKSYWVAAKYDGKSWIKLPTLTLNKTAEVLQIKTYAGSLYVSGNFLLDNGTVNTPLVRFKDQTWQAVAKIGRVNQVAPVISALEIFDKKLILGGNFNTIGNDTFQYIAAYDGIVFSNVFAKVTNCKTCFPNYFVTDLASNDSLLAISGYFSAIGNISTKSLFLLNISGKSDSFAATSNNTLFDKIALNGRTIYGAGANGTDKRINIYKAENGYTHLNANIDSVLKVNDLEIFDHSLWMNGISRLSGKLLRSSTLHLLGNTWIDYTSNYPNTKSMKVGRGAIWAIGSSEKPISIWSPNSHVVRLFQNSALVTVKVFLDSTNNCVFDKKIERPAHKEVVKLTTPFVNKYSVTNEQGMAEFLFDIKPLDTTNVKFKIILPRNYGVSDCASDSIPKTFKKRVKYLDSITFPIRRKTNINDIKVTISAPKGTQVMKDKRMEYVLSLENVGSNIVSGKMTLNKNKWLSSEKTDGELDTNKVEWKYSNLNPGEKRIYTYSGVASDARFVDNTLLQASAIATISSVQNDYEEDDADSIEQIIDNTVNAFRKDIYPIPNMGDSISYISIDDREIRYNISFNNFGTDTVHDVVIVDTLDLNLDMSYIQETGSNKPYYTELQTDPNNPDKGIIIWHFPNINLAPNPLKNFELQNSGSYIGFKIVLKPIINGYLVKNTASAFFDNYFTGKTNVTYCTIANTGIEDIPATNKGVIIYPNPASTLLNIDLPTNSNDQYSIINQLGVEVLSGTVENTSERLSLNIESLSSGIYMLRVLKGDRVFYGKFVKM